MSKLSKKDLLYSLIVLVWPIIFLIRYVIGDHSWGLKLKMDVIYTYYPMVYLLDCLSNWKFPLWSPGEGAGFPFWSSPFNSALYPLNLVYAFFYNLLGGFSWADYQRVGVLGVSIFSFNLYHWLRSLRVEAKVALVTALVMCMSYKVTGSLNRVQAVHSLAWMIMMLWGCTLCVYPGKRVKAFFLLAISTFMLLSMSYPYYIYYCVFLIPPYLLLLLFKESRLELTDIAELNYVKFFGTLATGFGVSFALLLPYLYQLASLSARISGRDKGDMGYAIGGDFSIKHTLASLFSPAYSDMRGWYYMGFVVLFVIVIYALGHFINLSKQKLSKKMLLGFLLYFIFISAATYGKGPVFKLLWNVFPGFGSFRAWARLNVVMVPLFSLLFAFGLSYLFRLLFDPESRSEFYQQSYIRLLAGIAVFYGIALAVQAYFMTSSKFDAVWQANLLKEFPTFSSQKFMLAGALAFVFFALLIVSSAKSQKWFQGKTTPLILSAFLVVFSACDMGLASIKLRSQNKPPSAVRKVIDVNMQNAQAFDTKRSYNIRLADVKTTTPSSVLLGKMWYYGQYNDWFKDNGGFDRKEKRKNGLERAEKRPPNLDKFLGVKDGKRYYCSAKNDFQNLNAFMSHSSVFEEKNIDRVDLIKYTGDYLEVLVTSQRKGYFNFIDNNDPDWKARLNGKDIQIESLFGTFKSIPIKKGINNIQLLYSPFPFSVVSAFPTRVMNKEKPFEEERTEIKQLNRKSRAIKAARSIVWTDTVGVSMTDSSLVKTAKNGWGNSGAGSLGKLRSGSDGAFDFFIEEGTSGLMIGYSDENRNAKERSIKYALFISPNYELSSFQKGIYQSNLGRCQLKDKIRIERIDGKIYIRQNNKIIYEFLDEVDYDLVLDMSFLRKGANISNLRLSFN